jgi:hypothetical protein
VELTLLCGRARLVAEQMIPNGCRGQSRQQSAERLAAEEYVAGEFLVADTRAGPRGLDVADVIVCPDEPARHRGSRPAWSDGMLARYPGCAVAVTSLGARGCLAAIRSGEPIRFAAGPATAGAGMWAVVCGSVVHGWLAAGWPVAAFEPQRLQVSTCTRTARPGGWQVRGQVPGVPFSCRIPGSAGALGMPVPSRCLSCCVSGAPSSA